jgi:large subunit ribosomal protein L23
VLQDATKPEVKAAVELMFKVEVERPGAEPERQGEALRPLHGPPPQRAKKAYVCLKPGQEINFAEAA